MKAPLAPHNEQDGWVYIRVRKVKRSKGDYDKAIRFRDPSDIHHREVEGEYYEAYPEEYVDVQPASRIISSRRVEEAVETADYLKRCEDEGLHVSRNKGGEWSVGERTSRVGMSHGGMLGFSDHVEPYNVGNTLREAYWRYQNVDR